MGFSRKPSFTRTKEEIAEMKRPLTPEEEVQLDKELEEMFLSQEETSVEDIINQAIKNKENIDYPDYLPRKINN